MAHTFDVGNADRLEDIERFRYCSREELVAAIGPDASLVVDLGSGTGFYARELAPYVDTSVGLDVQRAMHDLHRRHGQAENVRLVTADVDAVPLASDSVDVAYSTMTFHEFCTPAGLDEVARVLRPGGRFVNVDWTAEGEGAEGPPLAERQSAASAAALVRDAGLEVERAADRPETFVLVALAPGS